MTYKGKMKNGVVVLEMPDAIPDGVEVSIRPLKARCGQRPKTVYERYSRSIGKVKGLANDFSINHDHYLYGTPKHK